MPDLTAARETATAQLSDACTITRDPEGYSDDAIDPDTLEFEPPNNDDDPVYEGACLVGPSTAGVQEVGGQYVQIARRLLRLPFDAAVPKPGDKVVITASGQNSTLVGARFRVGEVENRSLFVTRIVTIESAEVVA